MKFRSEEITQNGRYKIYKISQRQKIRRFKYLMCILKGKMKRWIRGKIKYTVAEGFPELKRFRSL